MSEMRFFLSGVVGALLGLGVAWGQDSNAGRMTGSPPSLSSDPTPILANPPGPGAPGTPTEPIPYPQGFSPFIVYPRSPGCTGPVGCNGPIGGEIYLRTGLSIPFGGNFFGRLLEPGWQLDGGARSIFYDKDRRASWSIDLGVTTIFNDTNRLDVPVDLTNIPGTTTVLTNQGSVVGGLAVQSPTTQNIKIPIVPIAVKHMNRTYGDLGGGREWYYWGTPQGDCLPWSWRMGVDAGGRYGTMRVDINHLTITTAQLRHLTDTIAGVYCGWHTDVLIPFGPGLFTAGFRAEWAYTWSDVLQNTHVGDIMDCNLMGTIGFLF